MTDSTDLSKQFAGQYAVITGGTQGMGEAVARLFAARGAAGLVICGRNSAKGDAVAGSLTKAGCKTHYVEADLAKVEDCRKIIAAADKAFGKLHVLVNCAGYTDRGTIIDTSPELFDRMFAINVRAPFFLMQDTIKIMRRERIAGAIVNLITMSSYGGQPFITAYCSSKGALVTLTRNVAFSVMREHIRVNGINVGWSDTPGEDHIMKTYHGARDGWLAEAEKKQPFGRLIKPAEVARAIAFLASSEAGLMSGAIVDYDQSVRGAYESPPQPPEHMPETRAAE
jgi:NAD(P)-dependent dehydrogenase (short-subunit alcohol dehydrogenase family)